MNTKESRNMERIFWYIYILLNVEELEKLIKIGNREINEFGIEALIVEDVK
jgi:hypothetical protein